MIDENTARELLGEYIYIVKSDGFKWTGILEKVTATSVILSSDTHGKSIVSLEKIDEMGLIHNKNGGDKND